MTEVRHFNGVVVAAVDWGVQKSPPVSWKSWCHHSSCCLQSALLFSLLYFREAWQLLHLALISCLNRPLERSSFSLFTSSQKVARSWNVRELNITHSFWAKKSSLTALVTAHRSTFTTLNKQHDSVSFLMHVGMENGYRTCRHCHENVLEGLFHTSHLQFKFSILYFFVYFRWVQSVQSYFPAVNMRECTHRQVSAAGVGILGAWRINKPF